jgi:Sec-independent protein translocase protein TatA
MVNFHQTGYGRTFFKHQLPQLTKNIGKLADEMKRSNDLKEKELHDQNQQDVEGMDS